MACLGSAFLSLGAGTFSAWLMIGELNAGLTALTLGIIAIATGWSALRRAHTLSQTVDLLDVPAAVLGRARVLGLVAMVAGAAAMTAWPMGVGITALGEALGQEVPRPQLRPDPNDALRPQLDGRPAGSALRERMERWSDDTRDSYERDAEALKAKRERWEAFKRGDPDAE